MSLTMELLPELMIGIVSLHDDTHDDARNRKEFDRSASVRFVLSGDHGGKCLHGLRETVNTIIGR